jgi:hypothetical protein
MPELSLTKLAEGRRGTQIRYLECRTMRPRKDSAVLEANGLQDLGAPGGVLYGLPQRVAENETLLNVRLGQRYIRQKDGEEEPANLDDWILSWERLTKKLADTVPEKVIAESSAFGGSAGLEERIRRYWETLSDEDDNEDEDEETHVIVTAQYALTGWTSKLLRAKPRRIGSFNATLAEAFWILSSETNVLTSVSLQRIQEGFPRDGDEEIMITAVGVVESVDVDVSAVETQLWQEVVQLLEEST